MTTTVSPARHMASIASGLFALCLFGTVAVVLTQLTGSSRI
ncbi:hypothetical protein C8D87_1011650 [Lentzea atacamensis]|uniref:Uncharacterized protein n=1 Tax=Lentzea atacamensis TaxID=531938 RepID=A0ABX9EML1_9PSEU|nr:hypothetical protein [Lentzea atacamensis]RAS71349.1 hypothetical protein C8D87_1011650 [Lentzea atacamensis]